MGERSTTLKISHFMQITQWTKLPNWNFGKFGANEIQLYINRLFRTKFLVDFQAPEKGQIQQSSDMYNELYLGCHCTAQLALLTPVVMSRVIRRMIGYK